MAKMDVTDLDTRWPPILATPDFYSQNCIKVKNKQQELYS